MDMATQFWGAVIGGSIVGSIVMIHAAFRHGDVALAGVTLRDFPGLTGVARPLQDPSVNAAFRRSVGGWRVLWVILSFGLVLGSVTAAWNAASPATLQVESFGTAVLRAVVCTGLSFWILGRLIVASIHRHLEPHQRQFGSGIEGDPSQGIPAGVQEALESGDTILAIKRFRQATGAGLREANEFVQHAKYRT
jgi:hypothetical protein